MPPTHDPEATAVVEDGLTVPLLQSAGHAQRNASRDLPPPMSPIGPARHGRYSSWVQTTTTLLTLQLGWGLWLFPSDFAHLGWIPSGVCLVALTTLTIYSGFLFTRMYQAVPGAVLFGDIGAKAAGSTGRQLVYVIIYSLDATRCVILHLAASQSLRHIFPEDASGQGLLGGGRPPLWQCGLAVLGGALLLVQVRSLARLSWFFLLGTGSQLVAVGIVVWQLLKYPDPTSTTEKWVPLSWDTFPSMAVALMNMVFAFGGQFAFVEVMGSMKSSNLFPSAVGVCTVIMASVYAGLGIVGYRSQGTEIGGIIIFSLPDGILSQLAAAMILLQATAQYLVNLNVWTHNLLTLLARYQGHTGCIECASDHKPSTWFWGSLFVLSYSFAIAVAVPFFSPLVGLVTSVTYLSCAYTIPAWFTLKLLGSRLGAGEKFLLRALIPLSLVLSVIGFYSSVVALVQNIGGGEGGFD